MWKKSPTMPGVRQRATGCGSIAAGPRQQGTQSAVLLPDLL